MHHANCKHRCGARFLKIGLLVLAGIAVLGYVVMLLWNTIMPDLIDSAHSIGYFQALGLLVLSRILFGGLRGHGCHRRLHRHYRWHHMSEGERAQLREAGCGCGGKCEGSSEAAAEATQE